MARVTVRFDFDADRRIGPGKVALLEAIARDGSISAAGREFGMSYRRAWLLVDELNKMFAEPVVIARGGGKDGGGATLTALGEEVVAEYRSVEASIQRTAARRMHALAERLAPAAPAASAAPLDVADDD